MCGIAGIVSFKDREKLKYIGTMLDALRHRGPDGEGYVFLNKNSTPVCFGGGDTSPETYKTGLNYSPREVYRGIIPENAFAVLGHRLLSIIDLSPASHQPMSNKDGSLWVVFNGEVYNYIELREELKKRGYKFTTNTDTEVLLNAYGEWGNDCLSKFNGMWSFVIYDKRKNVLFGSRDRFGVKPFYYFYNQNYFTFASEIKALMGLPFIEKRINPSAVFDYLVFGLQENEEEGFLKGIFELPPSFVFELDLLTGNFKKWKYYALHYFDRWEKFDEKKSPEFSGKIRRLIFNAVNLRLRSDVPVGSCLSGGIDSSSLVCIINDIIKEKNIPQIGERQKIFTACYENEAVDESRWAGMVAEDTKTSWFKIFPKADELLKDMEDFVYYQDIPFISTSIYAQYRVMKHARENGIKVLLDGQGGDELFSGYHSHYIAFFGEILRHFDISAFIREFKFLPHSPVSRGIVLRSIIRNILPSIFRGKSINRALACINGDFLHKNKHRFNLHTERVSRSLNKTLFENMTCGSFKNLLRYEDRNSMRFSIEARAPFADDIDLIEYMFKLPSAYKIHNGFSKYLLRQSMSGIIPEEIRLRRDKIGFVTPETKWLNELKIKLKDYMVKGLNDFINISELFKCLDGLNADSAESGFTSLWRFINFAVWKKKFGL